MYPAPARAYRTVRNRSTRAISISRAPAPGSSHCLMLCGMHSDHPSWVVHTGPAVAAPGAVPNRFTVTLVLSLAACNSLPRDPNHTLDRVRKEKHIRVGL